jgi:hypothetical protein
MLSSSENNVRNSSRCPLYWNLDFFVDFSLSLSLSLSLSFNSFHYLKRMSLCFFGGSYIKTSTIQGLTNFSHGIWLFQPAFSSGNGLTVPIYNIHII